MLTLASVRPRVNTARRFEKRINKAVVNVRNDEGDHVKTMQDCQLELDER